MKNIKCSDCAEYLNEWCEKIVDSPCPDMLRDCQYWHERKDMVEVIRCKDCKYSSDNGIYGCTLESFNYDFNTRMYANDFCSRAERRSDDAD